MNNDLFFYDPLFGVILLISIILVIILADYGRNLLRAKQKKNNLKEFVQSYKEGSLSDEVAEFFALSKNPLSALLFLANTHNRAGDSNAAIKLYLGILKEVTNDADKMIILEELGETYFKAGFLERAKTIFLELLKAIPNGSKLIILGDDGQLTAIGEGAVFSDLKNSYVIPKIELTKIHRQAEKYNHSNKLHD